MSKKMSKKNSCKIISLNVRGIEIRLRGAVFLHILKIREHCFTSFKRQIPKPVMSCFGEMNGEVKSIFRMALVTAKVFAYFSIRPLG